MGTANSRYAWLYLEMLFQKEERAWDVDQRKNICVACVRPWLQSSALELEIDIGLDRDR